MGNYNQNVYELLNKNNLYVVRYPTENMGVFKEYYVGASSIDDVLESLDEFGEISRSELESLVSAENNYYLGNNFPKTLESNVQFDHSNVYLTLIDNKYQSPNGVGIYKVASVKDIDKLIFLK